MTDLLEDRLRRSLSAVADSTSIPSVPEPGSLAVVRPIRRRVVFGTAGVGIAAAVTAVAVVVSGGTDLAGPRAGVLKAPTPLSELQASAAANCVTGQASSRAEQLRADPTLPAGQGFSYNDPNINPRLASDLLYVAPESAGWPLTSLEPYRICDPSFGSVPPPVLAVVRLGSGSKKIVAAANVRHPAAGDRSAPEGIASGQPVSLHGVTGAMASSGHQQYTFWWTGPDGLRWQVQTSGMDEKTAATFTRSLKLDGEKASAGSGQWSDVTDTLRNGPSTDDYEVDSNYGLNGSLTYVEVSHSNVGTINLTDSALFASGEQEEVLIHGKTAVLSRFSPDSSAQLLWEPTSGVWIMVQMPVPAGGSTAPLIAFANSLQLVAPDDPALVPVSISSSSPAVGSLPASPSDFAPGTHGIVKTPGAGGWMRLDPGSASNGG